MSKWYKLNVRLPEFRNRLFENQEPHFIIHFSFFILNSSPLKPKYPPPGIVLQPTGLYFRATKSSMKQIALLLVIFAAAPVTQAQRIITRTVDYRYAQSPVKNQDGRGTCTAFAIAACLETFPGVPADLSEQYIYASLKVLNYPDSLGITTKGANLAFYGPALSSYGAVHEAYMPYEGDQIEYDPKDYNLVQIIRESHTGPISMLMMKKNARYFAPGFKGDIIAVEGEGAKDAEAIIRLLNSGVKAVAASYSVSSKWFEYDGVPNHLITPDDMLVIKDSTGSELSFELAKTTYGLRLGTMVEQGKIKVARRYPSEDMGHAITIVGYTPKGFIFKNSWGTGWGDAGYGFMSYDYHVLFARRYFAVKKMAFKAPAPAATSLPLLTDVRLKTIPQGNNSGGLSLSLFFMNKEADPGFQKAVYKIYQVGNGKRKLLAQQTVSDLSELSLYKEHAFETILLGGNYTPQVLKSGTEKLEIELQLLHKAAKTPVRRVFKNVKWAANEWADPNYMMKPEELKKL
jgi:Papain family cysteine protease